MSILFYTFAILFHIVMLSTLTYHPSGALFERNPVCGVCWHVCMQMCEDRGGSLNFDLLRSMEQADRLCARIVADTWSLCGIEHYYHWLEDQLSYSRPAVACATATVCLTLALMDDVPEPLLQFSRDMRGLLYGEAGELYDTMRSSAYRQDITLSANIYGTPPSVTPQQALINTLQNENQQLKNQLQAMSKTKSVHIGYNVEQMTINMSGGTLVQHADLVQAGGEVTVQQETSVEDIEQVATEPQSALPFFVPEKLAELGTATAEEFDALYHNAVQAGAPKLATFIKHYRELQVLNTKGYNKKKTYEQLKAYFGEELGFGYANFAAYY